MMQQVKSVLLLCGAITCMSLFLTSCGGDDDDVEEVIAKGGMVNGHEYVDLGLSVKWATMNVGASSPEDYGDYIAWGETTGYNSGKTDFSWRTYQFCGGTSSSMSKYCSTSFYGTVDNYTTLELSDDAANVNWGGTWRMPTDSELVELRTKCTWTWASLNGMNGYKVTGKNGNSIFMPAAGYRNDTYLIDMGVNGYYWSSSLYTTYPNNAWTMFFAPWNVTYNSPDVGRSYGSRYAGQCVRPVCP